MENIIVHYTKEGIAVPDHQTESFILTQLKDNQEYYVSTENVIHNIRALHKEKIVSGIKIFFNGKDMEMDDDGRIANWPDGFCDCEWKILERLL
jgi:hypothetical protein